MDLSIFLAKALGIYLFVISIGMLVSAARIRALIIDLIKSPPLMFLSGFIALIIGILLIVSHNVWVADWRVVITIVGWLAFIKGLVRIISPQFGVDLSIKWIKNNSAYYITTIITLLFGIYLLYYGYFQSPY